MKGRRGVIFSAESLFATMIGISVFFMLIGHYGDILGQMAGTRIEMRNTELLDRTMKSLIYSPGGHLIAPSTTGGYWTYDIGAEKLYGYPREGIVSLSSFVKYTDKENYLYPFWPEALSRGRDITVPGLAVYDTREWAPVTYVLHSKKCENLQEVVDLIYDSGLNPGERITVEISWGARTIRAQRGAANENNTATYVKQSFAWMLDVGGTAMGDEKMVLVTVKASLDLFIR
jgi:hypothetical protein